MDNNQPQGGAPPKPPPIPTYASKVASITPLTSIQYHTAFIDPTEGRMAAWPTTSTKRLAELVNPRAIAYNTPEHIAHADFTTAVFSTHSDLFASHNELGVKRPIICSRHFLHIQHGRVEVVYHEALDVSVMSNTLVWLNNIAYPPLSSTLDYIITKLYFSDFHFQSSADLDTNMAIWVKHLIETEKEMGKVIKIEVSWYRSRNGIHLPGHQVIACHALTFHEHSLDNSIPVQHSQRPQRLSTYFRLEDALDMGEVPGLGVG
ncbi:hypothetical protein BGX24_012272 [Mortierella sp. AD032]|nr:hypothetical protein BGX24_012272 [Mortierella sp. AD032]